MSTPPGETAMAPMTASQQSDDMEIEVAPAHSLLDRPRQSWLNCHLTFGKSVEVICFGKSTWGIYVQTNCLEPKIHMVDIILFMEIVSEFASHCKRAYA